MSERPLYYDINGKPMEMMAWAKAQTPEGKRVAEDTIEAGGRRYWVSTVWMGLDHNFSQTGPPLIFETMVFNADTIKKKPMEGGDWSDLMMDRYATKAEALAGHADMCARVQAEAPIKENDDDLDAS